MDDSHKKKGKSPDLLADEVFLWSLDDVRDERLYTNKVKSKIPESFHSVQHYFRCFKYPLLEETRAQVHSSMVTINRAPYAKVGSIANAKGQNLYNIKVDYWRYRFNDRGKEPYQTLPGDLFVLTNAKPETLSDLQRVGRSWAFGSVTTVSENENKDGTTPPSFKVKASKDLQSIHSCSTQLFIVFLVNLIPNGRIWKALHMYKNLEIINKVLRTDSVVQKSLCSEKDNEIVNKGSDLCSSSGLNESQNGTVSACLEMLCSRETSDVELIWGPPGTGKTKTIATLLSALLERNCRTLVCAPTNVAITEIASRLVKMVTEVESDDWFHPLGEVLLFGNKERLKGCSDIQEICLDYRLKMLVECLGPQAGWRHCFTNMIDCLENGVSQYHTFLENELIIEKEPKIKAKESTIITKDGQDKCKTFLEFIRDKFVSTASPLRHCLYIFCTHIAKYHISEDNFQNLVLLMGLVVDFQNLLFQDKVASEALEEIFSPSKVEDISETCVLFKTRRGDCLKVLRELSQSLEIVGLPEFMNQESLTTFCFQSASLIFCTASSSYMLHKQKMKPLSIVVIDEAAQLKECESTIPLQLPGVKHAVLVGDECQLPAIVESTVSNEAGFGRSLFERLSSVGHPRHLLNMQYRMHPSISSFPNSRFYNNMIVDAPNLERRSEGKNYCKGSMFGSYSFINVNDGREEKDEDGRSWKNMVEVAVVSQILRKLHTEWLGSGQNLSIGIVSPYAAQVVAIEDKLGQKYNNLAGFIVKVKTVDGFQGGEEDVIIISTVRSSSQQSLEFISNPKRINVALTRARHCLWVVGNEKLLYDSVSAWKDLIVYARDHHCCFNADDDADLAKAIRKVKKQLNQLDDLLSSDSVYFRDAIWKVRFSDSFMKSFKKLRSVNLKSSVLNALERIGRGWRPKMQSSDIPCGNSSLILKKMKVQGLYIVYTTDIAKDKAKDSGYIQVLNIWDVLPIEHISALENRLVNILNKCTHEYINLCKENNVHGKSLPNSWPSSLKFSRFEDHSSTETQNDVVVDASDGQSYAEISRVSESLLLMKFYSLTSGTVNHLLSDHEGRELDLPFEVTDEEMDTILDNRSSFILGRSGTGKTTVLTMKLYENEQEHRLAVQGCHRCENSEFEDTEGKVLRQLFVTVSPKLCYAIKQHLLNLKRFASGSSHSTETSLIDMTDFDEDEAQFNNLQDSFCGVPPDSYPLVITLQKFLIMLDGTLGNSYFERFLEATEVANGQVPSSRSIAWQSSIRKKEVSYEKFSSVYWPRFNTELTKKLDASRVFTEIISHIKGGLGAIDAFDGKRTKLKREEYVQLSENRASTLSSQDREVIYSTFLTYERMRMKSGEFDIADFVNDLHLRLRNEKYKGDQMAFVYIDEVQDLTMSQIALFKYMCHNVEGGFVFSGDTAQTIARGIDFRFEELRRLFYEKFVLASGSNKQDVSKEKGQISVTRQLIQNFRTHAGILKLSQSIVELIYHFFPSSIDVLKPESSLIYGEAPVLLESGKNENAFATIFGNAGNVVGFGAEQVILVRDDSARNEISKYVGEHALVLTIVECKGLEFQDVLLYNFFGSSPLTNVWRVIYGYMDKLRLFDHTSPKGFPSFDVTKHNLLCSELKQLYVAVTRTRQRLWICENSEEPSKPIFEYWKKKCLVQVKQLDDSLAHAMQVASSPEEWTSRGMELYHGHNYERARICFEKAGNTHWERRSEAARLEALADRMHTSKPVQARSFLREAAEIFEAIGKADSAARCFYDSGEYERAARIYLSKHGDSELERAAEWFSLAGCYEDAALAYAKGNFFSECLTVCAKGNLFETGLQYIRNWKQDEEVVTAITTRGNEISTMEQEFLKSCALHYHKLEDNRSMMKFVKEFNSIELMRDFLRNIGSLDELLLLEGESGNYLEAAEIARLKGDILLESDFLDKAGKFKEASLQILLYVYSNSLWSSGRKGWPMKKFPKQDELLMKAKSFAEKGNDDVCKRACAELEILLNMNMQDKLAVWKQLNHASSSNESVRGETLLARQILDFHLSSRTDKYKCESWDAALISDQNQVSIDTLAESWLFWAGEMECMTGYLGFLGTSEYDDYREELCFSCLGVWRLLHNQNPVYVLLIPDADWVRDLDKRYLKSYGKLVSIDVHQLIPAAQKYFCSELLSVGNKVLEKLETLFKFPPENDNSTFQCKALAYICEFARNLLNAEYLELSYHNKSTLQKHLSFSTDEYVPCIFPLDWRSSLRRDMISHRGVVYSRNVLDQVIDGYASSKKKLSYGQIGMIAMIILGSGKLNTELSEKLVKKLECHALWKAFIENLCASQEPIELSVMQSLHEALVETYKANISAISPGCFLYLVERLLFSASCFHGFVITTGPCFIEWLIYQDEGTKFSFRFTGGGLPSQEGILPFVIDVVRDFIFKEKNIMIEWIQKFEGNGKKCYQVLLLRLVIVVCVINLNFGSCMDIINRLLGMDSFTEILPSKVVRALRMREKPESLSLNALARVLKEINYPLIVADFGAGFKKYCKPAIGVNMKDSQQSKEDILKWLPFSFTSVKAEGSSSSSQEVDTSTPSSSNEALSKAKNKNKKNKKKGGWK